tara:strand:+ start:6026 stop:7228 length:1203 start_codon:yes stop_codon:yes gene_type:complete
MNSSKLFTAVLATSAAVLAQGPLQIAGLDTSAVVWEQDIDAGQAIVRYDELAGERTLLFSHVTIDETVAGTLVAAGIIDALPFLASPTTEQWQLSASELAGLAHHHFTGFSPMVPPRRIAQHLVAYGAASSQDNWGTTNTLTTGFTAHMTFPSMVSSVTANADERKPWANSIWAWHTPVFGYGFDTAQVGREAVLQSAYEYVAAFSLPPISPPAIAGLNALMDSKLGFEIYVQAAHLTSVGNEVEVRISRHSRIRRRSLHQLDLWPFGPSRFVPLPTNEAVNLYLAPRGDFLHIEFPVAVGTTANPTTLRAYVPTTNGLVIVDQVSNPLWEGELMKPHVGIFPCPANAVDGICYIDEASNPGQRFAPLGHYGNAALISAYDVPTGPLVPPAVATSTTLPQ